MMKLLLICLVLVVCAVSAAKPFQLKSRLAKKMCAAGKSNWSTASGSGPLTLQPCTMRNVRVKNINSIFTPVPSTESGLFLFRRNNQNKKQFFCLTNHGGPLPALAFEKPCLTNSTTQMWTLADAPLIRFGASDLCLDTLGATQKFARITLQPCDTNRKSQRFDVSRV